MSDNQNARQQVDLQSTTDYPVSAQVTSAFSETSYYFTADNINDVQAEIWVSYDGVKDEFKLNLHNQKKGIITTDQSIWLRREPGPVSGPVLVGIESTGII